MNSHRAVSRRTLLGGAVAAVVGTVAVPEGFAFADNRFPSGAIDLRSVDAVAHRLDKKLIELRRDIHSHPEIAGQEQRTAELVAGHLRTAGLDVTTDVGGHGVVGVLTGARPGRTIAYRADMDAVPPSDQVEGGPTPAHLCGHDIHTAVAVGVAQVLARLRDRLAGTVMFVFQPAEEALTGAAAMLADGVFAATRPAEIHALHCGPFPVGEFAVTAGYGLPGQDRGIITVAGPDAMARAQRLAGEIGALSTVSAPTSPAALEQLVTDIQTPHGPLTEFVFLRTQVPQDRAEVRVSYRCWPQERYVAIREEIHRLARSYDGTEVTFPPAPFPAMICPEREGHAVERYLRRTLGQNRVRTLHAAVPFSGEDFALFLNQVPGTYTFLGVRRPGARIETSYPHFGTFNPDERAIAHGVRAMAGWLPTRAHTD
ncbi:M20 metallopeptidase family protein [Actinocrispum wychmicini]|uniref:Amidohydrolase n=1 Tax=Actinocrispum wychmicini TaxID=1213861 RepID=A0A4R2JDH2_9PSEU|nr:amidohydrolase [Actinocrispum wychmicini]TCO54838.1 amidohydrolase [Actinocrispum wychmicini]